MRKKRFYDAVRDLIRDVNDPPQPVRTRRRLSIASLLAAPLTCAACWDPVPSTGTLFSCNSCLCAFCPPCLSHYARAALSDKSLLPLRCADTVCRAPVPLSALDGLLQPDEIERLSIFQCQIVRNESTPQPVEQNDEQLWILMNEKGWQRCPSCGTGIERMAGCPHMVCVCGSEFCYSCGEPWRAGGYGCPRRCGLPQNDTQQDDLLAMLPRRFDDLRDDVLQRIAVLLGSLHDTLERDRLPAVSAVNLPRWHLPSPPRQLSGTEQQQPDKMRLGSLVHPNGENWLGG